MRELKFDRIGDMDRFVLIVDGEIIDYGLTLDEVLAYISKEESEMKK